MNFDRNTLLGFIFLGVLFLGFFYYNSKQQEAYQIQKAKDDSLALAAKPKVKPGTTDTARNDSFQKAAIGGEFQSFGQGTEQLTIVENEVLRVAFTNKGGQPKWVEMKKFKGPDSALARLGASGSDGFDYRINTEANSTVNISELFFTGSQVTVNPDSSQTIAFQVGTGGHSIIHQYTVRKNNYLIDFNLQVNGGSQLLSQNALLLNWHMKAEKLQKDVAYERQQSQIGYREQGEYDYTSALKDNSEEFKKPVNWLAVKQQFFNTTLIAKNNFSSGNISWKVPVETDKQSIVDATANMKLAVPNPVSSTVPLALYYGPTDYKTLKQYGNDMENMVNLGSGIFSFVKYINRYVIIPIFDLFSKLTSNFGIVILLLTLFIRLIISPLTYSSYLSGAKMKVLRPEIDQLKAKYGKDQQQMSMEQMRLFREAGVNPLGGCIPAVLQIPIFFALYSFFNSNVALRGQSFLWASDLSQSDSIFTFGHVPVISWIYGDHVSLFTITAVITSFLISLYSMSMTPDQNNPVLKYMPYFFPVILLFIFNKLPSGLTWYYTVSNIITLALQFVIQNYIIDHEKILAKMELNKKKPKKQSKWQEKMTQIQEQQKQMKDAQNKNRR